MDTTVRWKLRAAVHSFYDLQRLRISALGRSSKKHGDAPEIILDAADEKYLDALGKSLNVVERVALKEVERQSQKFGAINDWLREIKGVGPTIAGFLLSEFDPAKAPRPSCFWSFAGLHVEDGHSPHPIKGEKLAWNRWLRTKCIFVLGGSFLKSGNERYRPLYDGYKNRKENTIGPCILCVGTGKANRPKKGQDGMVDPEAGKSVTCWNCEGTGTGPWGRGDAHRHQAALRYMVKQFLLDFYTEWRRLDGYPPSLSYAEAKLGLVHAGV